MCVIDFLGNKTKSPEDMFYQKIDMDNIAVIGHSLGGYTAGNLCAHMNEVKTSVFFDTSPMSDYFYTDMKKPSLFIYAKTDNTINPYIHQKSYIPNYGDYDKKCKSFFLYGTRLFSPVDKSTGE